MTRGGRLITLEGGEGAGKTTQIGHLAGALRDAGIDAHRFDEAAATVFQRLHRSRIRMGTMALQIMSIVLSHHATLLSRHLGDPWLYKKVRSSNSW